MARTTKKTTKQNETKPAKPTPKAEGSNPDPATAAPAAPAEGSPAEPERFVRDAPKRPESEEKAIRALIKKGEKALEVYVTVLDGFDPPPERAVKTALKRLRDELEALKPPEPRTCKEFKRALALARKGEMGIHPDDVMKYCHCGECRGLRDKAGISHPPAPRAP